MSLTQWIAENKLITAMLAVIPVFMAFMGLIEKITGKKNIAGSFWKWTARFVLFPFNVASNLASLERNSKEFQKKYDLDRKELLDSIVRMELIIMDIQETSIISLDMLGVAYWVSDADGGATVVSKALQKVMGRSEAEIKGNNYSTYVRHEKYNVMEKYQESIQNHAIFDMDYECIKDDGTIQKVNGFAKHKYDRDGNYIGSLGRLLPL